MPFAKRGVKNTLAEQFRQKNGDDNGGEHKRPKTGILIQIKDAEYVIEFSFID